MQFIIQIDYYIMQWPVVPKLGVPGNKKLYDFIFHLSSWATNVMFCNFHNIIGIIN